MDIKVLGTGCAKCNSLYNNVKIAIDDMQLQATLEKVEEIDKIMEYGIVRTPGLVIDDKVVMVGQSPNLYELKYFLSNFIK